MRVQYNVRVVRSVKVGLFRADSLARYLLLCALDSSVAAMDKTYLIELVGDMRALWDHRDKNYRTSDLKPKLWGLNRRKIKRSGWVLE
jgi:hypothetical protein